MKFTHNIDYYVIKIMGEWHFTYFVIAIFFKENILVKFIEYLLFHFLNCYKRLNKISLTYDFYHVLIYIMGKLHGSTTFHWFDFAPKSLPPNADFWKNLALKSSQSVSEMSSMIHFYYQRRFQNLCKEAQLKHRVLFAQQSPIWQPLCQPFLGFYCITFSQP